MDCWDDRDDNRMITSYNIGHRLTSEELYRGSEEYYCKELADRKKNPIKRKRDFILIKIRDWLDCYFYEPVKHPCKKPTLTPDEIEKFDSGIGIVTIDKDQLASRFVDEAEQFILDAISLKKGNKEVAIFYNPDCNEPWSIEVGNKSQYLNIGETGGEVEAHGETLFDVIMALKKK